MYNDNSHQLNDKPAAMNYFVAAPEQLIAAQTHLTIDELDQIEQVAD